MHVIVIRVREHGSVAIPIILMLVPVNTKHGKNRAVVAFHLPIGLGLVRTREHVRDSQDIASNLKKLGRELFAVVRDQALWWAILENPVLHESHGYIVCSNLAQGYHLGELCKPVRDDQQKGMRFLGPLQRSKNIDAERRLRLGSWK